MTKRRNMLREMDSDLVKIDSGLEKLGRAKGSLIDDLALTTSASATSSSSFNVKKRSMKTTITTETVRY